MNIYSGQLPKVINSFLHLFIIFLNDCQSTVELMHSLMFLIFFALFSFHVQIQYFLLKHRAHVFILDLHLINSMLLLEVQNLDFFICSKFIWSRLLFIREFIYRRWLFSIILLIHGVNLWFKLFMFYFRLLLYFLAFHDERLFYRVILVQIEYICFISIKRWRH